MSSELDVVNEEILDGIPKSEYLKLDKNERKVFRKNCIIQRIEKGGMKYIFESELANFFGVSEGLVRKEVKDCLKGATIVDLKALKINLNSKFEKNFEMLDKAYSLAKDSREISMVANTINQTISAYTTFLEKHGIKSVETTEVSEEAKNGAISLLQLLGKSSRHSHSGGYTIVDVNSEEKEEIIETQVE